MSVIKSTYVYVFDDVQFAIDIREAREKAGLTQEALAALLDYGTSSAISLIENAKYSQYLKMSDFLMLCRIFDLHAPEYFDLEKDAQVDYFHLMD